MVLFKVLGQVFNGNSEKREAATILDSAGTALKLIV
jgi:hypothetical protein